MKLIIDNFAGGGGASTGLEQAFGRSVDAAVNHDHAAIAVHAANHPGTTHYCQSIYSVDPLEVTGGRPVGGICFSPDCKHHSKAKGGKPRDKYIRDLAWVVPHWIERLLKGTPGGGGAPDVIWLENVEEFRDWGPLDESGKPIKERRGEEFDMWVRRIRRLGYKVDWRELRACDYGAPTSRKRLFLVARRDGLPISWPAPTHGDPKSEAVQSGHLLPWRTAAECIDWSIACPSIFDRTTPLKPTTCRRIAAGVMRYVINSARPFIVPITNTKWAGNRVWSADEPLRTITTSKGGEMALACPTLAHLAPHIMTMRNSGKPWTGADEPMHTIVANGAHKNLVTGSLISVDNTSTRAPRAFDVQDPLRTITTSGGGYAAVTAFMAQHNTGAIGHPVEKPLSTILHRGTQQQVVETTLLPADALPPEMMAGAVKCAAFLIKYYGNEDDGHGLDKPLGTVTTRDRFAVVTVTIDAQTYVLVDIGMRMLAVKELAAAMGFPADYVFDPECWYVTESGNRKFGRLPKSHQIAKIGNAVCPAMSRAIALANMPVMTKLEAAAA